MLSTIAFNNFKTQNIAFAVHFIDNEDGAENVPGASTKSVRRLARIHQKLRNMYFALSDAEREVYQNMGSTAVNGCVEQCYSNANDPR